MSKRKTQNILNVVIVLLVVMLIIMVAMVLYESKINENRDKNISSNAQIETSQKQENEIIENDTTNEQAEEEAEEYIGEEEKDSQEDVDVELTKDEKAIQLAKEKWGSDDTTVTYSIEEKKGNIYYIAVKSNATTISWYEVNTETWEISEFY